MTQKSEAKGVMESDNFSEKRGANPAYIDEDRNEAYTSAVTISHIEGDSDIEEIILFRIELDVFEGMDDSNLYLEVEMLFFENDLQNPSFEVKVFFGFKTVGLLAL